MNRLKYEGLIRLRFLGFAKMIEGKDLDNVR